MISNMHFHVLFQVPTDFCCRTQDVINLLKCGNLELNCTKCMLECYPGPSSHEASTGPFPMQKARSEGSQEMHRGYGIGDGKAGWEKRSREEGRAEFPSNV